MADAKISALTATVTPAGTDEFAINQSGTSKKTTLAQIMTFVTTAPVFAAGTASAGTWPKLTVGTLLTTPEAGAIELDANCFYFTTDAGNRGVNRAEHFIRLTATRTFTSNTSQQAIFNSPANGTLTLETGTYTFECMVSMNTMSVTSGNGKFSLIGAGTATLGSVYQQFVSTDVAVNTASSSGGSFTRSATVTATNIGTAGTAAEMSFIAKGTFEVTVAGTIIPSFAQTTAAAAVCQIGSYFRCNRIGATGVVSCGQWT